MKEDVSLSRFMDVFHDVGREKQFSYDGLKALYEYLTELEEDTGEEIELDVIALCCEFVEYESVKDYIRDYSSSYELKDFEAEEDFNQAVMLEVSENTVLIPVSGEGFIIQAY